MSKAIKRKGGPIPNAIKQPIIDELTKMVENGNVLGVNNKQLAEMFGKKYKINIKRQLIGTYLKKVYDTIPVEDIKNTQIKIETMFNKIFRIVQEMISSANTQKEKKEAIDLLLRAMDRFTVFLESFGIKQKLADNINIKADITQRSFNVQIIDDRRDAIANGTDNEDYQ